MSRLSQQIFTDAGLNILAQAETGQILTITRIVVGSGVLQTENQVYPLTQLVQWQADVTITRKLFQSVGKLLVSGVLVEAHMAQAQTTAPGGGGGAVTHDVENIALPVEPPEPAPRAVGAPFQLRELGIMARIGAGPEQLYCASNVFTDPPDTVTPG